MSRPVFFRVTRYTGWDFWIGLLPARWQARVVARRWRHQLQIPGGEEPGCPHVFELQDGSTWCLTASGVRAWGEGVPRG